jgi:hypothetical protein
MAAPGANNGDAEDDRSDAELIDTLFVDNVRWAWRKNSGSARIC